MNDGNWIKLNRSMLKWEWYDDVNTKAVFLHALLKANYEDGAYRGHKLCPGDVVFGRKKWAEQLGMSEQQVRTAIDHLKETGEISTIKTTNRFTILRIENWTLYQSKDDEATNKQPTSNHVPRKKRMIRRIRIFLTEGRTSRHLQRSLRLCLKNSNQRYGDSSDTEQHCKHL